ncbi:hypothetical protein [Telmatospirillum sp.]|uniref:hypothetical protein n=1 Tax=Telmatospirillum sp. TaxID=2079197 RepID=UPI0028462133|nr:hypothetical protein [Telmatospirillum sp.]MDR3436375.1 hypothetical protein [Telmatospirillum sp.]
MKVARWGLAAAVGLGAGLLGTAPATAQLQQLQGLLGKGEANITITPEALSKLCIWTNKSNGVKFIYSDGASQCFDGRNFQCKGNQWHEMKERFDGPCDAEARSAAMPQKK